MTGLREFEDELRATTRGVAAGTSTPAGLSDRLIVNAATPRRADRRPARGRYVPAVAAGVVVVVIVGIGVVVSLARAGDDHKAAANTVVPFNAAGVRSVSISEFGAASGVEPPREVDAPSGTRLCVGGDFELLSARSESTRDRWVKTSFVLRSMGSTNCAVSVRGSSGALTDASGNVLPNNVPASSGPYVPDLLVRPGELAAGAARWAWDGHSTARPARLIVLPDDRTQAVRLSISLAGVSIPHAPISDEVSNDKPGVMSVGVSSAFSGVADPGSLASLDAVVRAAGSIELGAPLRYAVELRNDTDVPVSLANCPDVVQLLGVVPAKVTIAVGVRGRLNCADAPAMIEPNSSVTFAFAIDSTGVVAGDGRLTWSLVAGDLTALSIATQIKVSP
jgi:hypothetical protein